MTGRLISDEMQLANPTNYDNRGAMDSSRLLLGLISLSRRAHQGMADQEDNFSGILARSILRDLLTTLQSRDVASVRHSRNVATLSVGMAEYLGWEGRRLDLIEVAALLHDIGKIGVPDNILFKPGKLGPDEADLMSLHHEIALDVLQACCVDPEVIEIIQQAHMQRTLSEESLRAGHETCQGAKILAVADAYDSMAADQVYRVGKPHSEIMEVLYKKAASQFDGNVVCALDRWAQKAQPQFEQILASAAPAEQAAPMKNPEELARADAMKQVFTYLYHIESMYDGFHIVDGELRHTVWNTGAGKLIGIPGSQLIGKTWNADRIPHADQNGDRRLTESECPLRRAIEVGRPISATIKLQRSDSRWIDVELQTIPLCDEYGRVHGVAEIFRDLTRSQHRPQAYQELRAQASRDALTSVANRGELETQLMTMIAEHHRKPNSPPFSVIFLDLDHFKQVNDEFGHSAGDAVLVHVAKLLESETYSGELIARYGGEEFVILCPETDLDQATRRAERLRLAVSNTRVNEHPEIELTASFGVAEVEAGDSTQSVVRRADQALYEAKNGGRNRVCSMSNSDMLELQEERALPQPARDVFTFSDSFVACVASEMIVYKLGGFVDEYSARLLQVDSAHARMIVGRSSWLPFVAPRSSQIPVELDVRLEPVQNRIKSASSRLRLSVSIRPTGNLRDSNVFQARARQVFADLKAYCAGE